MANTSAPVSGYLKSGVRMNRDNTSFPDPEQERREQARLEHTRAEGDPHPLYTRVAPDREELSESMQDNGSNLSRAESEAAHETFTE